MAVSDYSEEAKRIIAIAIESAIKHINELELAVDVEIEVNKKIAEYWPLGSEVNEQTGCLAIETFIKARSNVYM